MIVIVWLLTVVFGAAGVARGSGESSALYNRAISLKPIRAASASNP